MVSGRYDSLLAKVIAHGAGPRRGARQARPRPGRDRVLGVNTTTRASAPCSPSAPGEIDTERSRERRPYADRRRGPVARVAAAVEFAEHGRGDGWRLGGVRGALLVAAAGRGRASRETVVLPAGEAVPPGWVHARDGDTLWLGRDGHAWRVRDPTIEETHRAAADGQVKAPMPGSVLAVRVAVGDEVEEGDDADRAGVDEDGALDHRPVDGAVTDLTVAEGDRVNRTSRW